jgi:hypothetical protein
MGWQPKNFVQLASRARGVAINPRSATYEGKIRNLRFRIFTGGADSECAGQLHLANHHEFDRWANSLAVTVHPCIERDVLGVLRAMDAMWEPKP